MNDFYRELHVQLDALTDGCQVVTSNLANAAALLFDRLERINWVGFYLTRGEELLLGPFCGKPACLRIPFGKGVCGAAATSRNVMLVPDVHAFPGHIACDSASRSELVVPLVRDGNLLGVLDLDSPLLSRFSEEDAQGLSEIAGLLAALPGWDGYEIR